MDESKDLKDSPYERSGLTKIFARQLLPSIILTWSEKGELFGLVGPDGGKDYVMRFWEG